MQGDYTIDRLIITNQVEHYMSRFQIGMPGYKNVACIPIASALSIAISNKLRFSVTRLHRSPQLFLYLLHLLLERIEMRFRRGAAAAHKF